MINFGSNPAFILGIALALCGVALYAMRSMRPELSRDHDIFFAAIALISGLILMFQGWRLDPLLLLGQLSLAGSAVFFAVENIRLRSVTTEQAKRSTPIVDDDRPVSRRYEYDYDYQAEFDELPSTEDRRASRRIRGSRDRGDASLDSYGESRRRRPYDSSRRRAELDDDYRPASRTAGRRPLPRSRRPVDDDRPPLEPSPNWDERPSRRASSWDDDSTVSYRDVDVPLQDADDHNRVSREGSQRDNFDPRDVDNSDRASSDKGSPYRSSGREPKSLSRYRQRRASSGGSRYPGEAAAAGGSGGEYADYQPVDYNDDDPGDPNDYGDRYR